MKGEEILGQSHLDSARNAIRGSEATKNLVDALEVLTGMRLSAVIVRAGVRAG